MAFGTSLTDIPADLREAGGSLAEVLRADPNVLGLYWAEVQDGDWRLHMVTRRAGEIGTIAALAEILRQYPNLTDSNHEIATALRYLRSVAPTDAEFADLTSLYGISVPDKNVGRWISFGQGEVFAYFIHA